MVHSRIHSFSAENPSTQAKSFQFASRPAIQSQQDSRTFPIPAKIESEAFDRGVEAFGSHFAHIPVHAPDRPAPAPMQPPLAIPRSHAIAPIQAKLTIGQPNDKYEQEADRIAAQVVNQINPPQSVTQGATIQRQETNVEEDDKLQMKPLLQPQLDRDSIPATPELEAEIGRSRSGGQPLAESIRKPMERTFGADFSGVRVHADAQADQLNRSIQAKAFTTGQDMFFRQGTYQPGSRGGQELIAHELTHVVQQGGNLVQSIIQKAPFDNLEVKFRTDNEDPDIENSEYHVTAKGYERYAPINKYRLPSQFFHEGQRTFMYFENSEDADYFNQYITQRKVRGSKDGENIEFKYYSQTGQK